MNIIHTCITIRLNYPMTPLYHHNKTYVCAFSRYEIMIHNNILPINTLSCIHHLSYCINTSSNMVTLGQQAIRGHDGYLFVFNSFQICQYRVIIVIGIDCIAIIIRCMNIHRYDDNIRIGLDKVGLCTNVRCFYTTLNGRNCLRLHR